MKLIPLVAIGVSRDGQSVRPVIGKPFDFTADEKADLDRIHKEHGVESYREPVNEAPAELVPATLTAAEKKAAAKLAGEQGSTEL